MGYLYLLDDPRAFGINADQWTTAAQDEGEWRNTAGEGAEYFKAKWIAAEKARAGLRHAVSSMPEHDGKNQGEDSPKKACSCWFARRSSLVTGGANLYPPGDFSGLQMSCCLSRALRLFCFCFVSFSSFCFH